MRFSPACFVFLLIWLSFGQTASSKQTQPIAIFTEVSEQTGLRFQRYNGFTGKYHLPEIMGAGAALFDFDNDGDLDAYLPQGASLESASAKWTGASALRGRLFRNDLPKTGLGKDGKLKFTDVTETTGILAAGYGMGVAVGDINNDGWNDLYLCNLGANQMWLNKGDGTFTDVTEKTATAVLAWSSSASFFDYDRDGWLDLFVTNYVEFSVANSPTCYSNSTARDYCMPRAFKPAGNRLFRNLGNGSFQDVTLASGIAREFGRGLGVVTADFNNDGWPDVYIANDGDPNQLWINQQNGTFKNEALLAGAAVNRNGLPEAGMGVDAADFDANGTEDIFITHLMDETNTLFVNLGKGLFEDRTPEAGLALQSRRYTGFGTLWFDYDNDGWLDLAVANGAVAALPELTMKKDPFPFSQPNQLFRNTGKGNFEDVSAQTGQAFLAPAVGRGAAFGDVDNDGDTDVLIANNSGAAKLFLNQVGSRNRWLGLRLVGANKRDELGARIEVVVSPKDIRWRRARTDGGYQSAHDPRALVGLGQATRIETVRVHWPSGKVEEWKNLPLNRYHTLKEGTAGK
ncbi:MAG: CRTAC1 family protein [Blastocatellia bacterium]